MEQTAIITGIGAVSDGLMDIRKSLEFMQIACDELRDTVELGEYLPSLLGLLKGKAVDVDIQLDELATGIIVREDIDRNWNTSNEVEVDITVPSSTGERLLQALKTVTDTYGIMVSGKVADAIVNAQREAESEPMETDIVICE